MEFNEKTISKETVFQGRLLSLEQHVVEIHEGKHSTREIIRHAPAVAILAVQEDRMLFVKQYRKAIEKAILEIPAGLVDANEPLLDAAKREFAEETGRYGKRWKTLDRFYPSPGFLDEIIHVFACTEIEALETPPAQDEDEHLAVYQLTLEEAKAAIATGEICDMKTIYAVNQWEMAKLKGEM